MVDWKKPLFFGMEWFGHDLMNMVYYCSLRLIIFLVKCIHTGVKKQMEDFREWKQLETWVIWGFVLHSAQLPFFLGVFPGKEGRMNLEVSKSHSRCVATRQLIPKHQLTFSLYTSTLHGLHQIRNWTRGMFLPPQLPPSIRAPSWT